MNAISPDSRILGDVFMATRDDDVCDAIATLGGSAAYHRLDEVSRRFHASRVGLPRPVDVAGGSPSSLQRLSRRARPPRRRRGRINQWLRNGLELGDEERKGTGAGAGTEAGAGAGAGIDNVPPVPAAKSKAVKSKTVPAFCKTAANTASTGRAGGTGTYTNGFGTFCANAAKRTTAAAAAGAAQAALAALGDCARCTRQDCSCPKDKPKKGETPEQVWTRAKAAALLEGAKHIKIDGVDYKVSLTGVREMAEAEITTEAGPAGALSRPEYELMEQTGRLPSSAYAPGGSAAGAPELSGSVAAAGVQGRVMRLSDENTADAAAAGAAAGAAAAAEVKARGGVVNPSLSAASLEAAVAAVAAIPATTQWATAAGLTTSQVTAALRAAALNGQWDTARTGVAAAEARALAAEGKTSVEADALAKADIILAAGAAAAAEVNAGKAAAAAKWQSDLEGGKSSEAAAGILAAAAKSAGLGTLASDATQEERDAYFAAATAADTAATTTAADAIAAAAAAPASSPPPSSAVARGAVAFANFASTHQALTTNASAVLNSPLCLPAGSKLMADGYPPGCSRRGFRRDHAGSYLTAHLAAWLESLKLGKLVMVFLDHGICSMEQVLDDLTDPMMKMAQPEGMAIKQVRRREEGEQREKKNAFLTIRPCVRVCVCVCV